MLFGFMDWSLGMEHPAKEAVQHVLMIAMNPVTNLSLIGTFSRGLTAVNCSLNP